MTDVSLGQKLYYEFQSTSARRSGYEQLWLKDLRQYKGIYDPEVLSRLVGKRSKAFIRETRTKVRTIDARLMDLLFPANGEKNWAIDPTPNPELPPEQKMAVNKGLIMMIQQKEGQPRRPTREELELAYRTIAKDKARKMADTIEDQLAELKYRNMIKATLHSGNLYGTGWLKGPLVEKRSIGAWKKPLGATTWNLEQQPIFKPFAEFRPIWNVYPDMSVTELGDCRFVFERHLMPKHKLMALASRADFNGAIVKGYIEDMPQGDAKYTTFENEMYNLTDFNQAPAPTLSGMYELIEFWGYIEGRDLMEEGVADVTPDLAMMDIPVNVFILGGQFVVKIVREPIPGVVIPYHAYYFDKDETSIYGEGIASIMRDPQRLVNASVRAMIDNASHCAGPQYEVNVDLLDEGEDPQEAGAFKVWLRTGKDADVAGKEVVRIKQIASYTQEFLLLNQAFSKMGDEVTIVPRYMQGDSRVSGAGRTASGLSMLMGQANIGLSDQVKTYDDGITKPFITGMFNWNMTFNTDEEIKGDMAIQARGSTALMAKEIRAQQIIQFLQLTGNPYDLTWVKRGDLIRKLAESTDIGAEVVRSEQERADFIAENQQMGGGDQQAQLQDFAKKVMGALQEMGDKVQQVEQGLMMVVQQVTQPQMIRRPAMVTGGAPQ